MGVLQRIIFSHTPDEAMSGGLAKACVPGKNCSVPEKIRVPNDQHIILRFSYMATLRETRMRASFNT